ncbi:MAG TPA: hypothetical protein VFB77_01860 [Acidimicrobiales bacterium]|nr:hypothetical protein [Acidimicrobiales bacterium]
MGVEWQYQRLGRFRGYLDGRVVAHVAHLVGPGGRDDGWMVFIAGQADALPDRYPSEFEGMLAAETEVLARDGDGHGDGGGGGDPGG